MGKGDERVGKILRIISRPFLVYAYIREELISSSLDSPENYSQSLFVDSSHNYQEIVIQEHSTHIVYTRTENDT